jgi:hypothetical protein
MKGKKLSSDALEKWVGQASFVFRGRIKALGQSNLDGVEPDERMALVEVEEVVIAPRGLGDLEGNTVTVYLQSTQGIRPGQKATFFATSWHYGQTIGVVEVGRATVAPSEIRQAVIENRLRQLDEQIEERIRGAQLIVSARVLSTHRAERTEGLPGVEEGLQWWEAEMFVMSVEKGRPPDNLRIFFPVGGDEQWSGCPKCQAGQEGVWFLRPVGEAEGKSENDRRSKRQKGEKKKAETEEPLMAYDPLDYHAISALSRIQSLLWRAAKE